MSLRLELPRPLDERLAEEAQKEGVSATEHATLLLYLATALLEENKTTPFQEAVKGFLAQRSVDANYVASVLEDLVRLCLAAAHDEGKTTAAFQTVVTQQAVPGNRDIDYDPLRQWRNATVHGVNISPQVLVSQAPPQEVVQQIVGGLPRPEAPGGQETLPEQGRDPELVARVRRIRGKFAQAGGELASEALRRERQADKEKEEQQTQRKKT